MPKSTSKKNLKRTHKRRKATSSKRNYAVFFLLGIVVFIGIIWVMKKPAPVVKEQVVQEEIHNSLVYKGRLPCADCEGIDEVLILNADNTYSLHMTYVGRDTTFTETGIWEKKKGIPSNAQGEYYLTTATEGGSKTGYQIVNANEIKQLDGDLHPIDSPLNFTLTKE